MRLARPQPLVLALVTALLAFAAPAFAGPTIQVTRSWDGVAVPKGSTVAYTPNVPAGTSDSRQFTITNTGNTSLTISNPGSLVSGTGWSLIASPPASLASGASGNFRVRILSATGGTFTGTVSIASNDPDDNPYTFSVQATVNPPPAPAIRITQAWNGALVAKGGAVFYTPNVPAGTSDSRQFTITNTGSATLAISNPGSLVSGTGWSLIETPPSSLAAGATGNFRVRILSATGGTFTGTVSIASNDPANNPYSFSVQATVDPPPAPALRVTQAWNGAVVPKGGTVVYSPSIPAGVSDSRLYTLTNTGSAPLTINNPGSLVSGAGWSLIETPPASLAAGASGSFRVRILSATGGTFSGTVSIASNDPDDNPYAFSVQATVNSAGAPEIRVFRDWDNVELSPGTSFTFPDLAPGIADSRQFRIENQGPGTLTLTNPTSLVSGACFSQIGDPPASSLVQGASTLFRVRLQCGLGGQYTGVVSIGNNDGDENPFTLGLSGRVGTLPPIRITAHDGSLVAAGSTYLFPETGVQVAESRQFTIWNDGPKNLVLRAPTELVDGDGWSQIGDPPLTVIPAGGSTTFRVRLHTASAGTFHGQVTVETTAATQLPYRFDVTGSVGTPDFDLAVTPAQRNLVPGENVGYTLSVTGRFGFTDPVSLAVSGLPSASSATWTPPSVAPGGSSALRVFTSGATPVGLYALTLTGTSGGVSHSLAVFLNVRSAADFTVQVNPSLVSTSAGASASYQVSIAADTAVAGGVNLSASNLPVGFTASFAPTNVEVGGVSTLTVVTPETAAIDTYDVTVNASGGGLARSAIAQVRVANAEKPVLASITPDSFASGGLTRLTVRGSFLSGASASIAEEQTDPDDPVDRIFPTVEVISINDAGTVMEVEVNAKDEHILDFYNLVVDNGAGIEAIQFRVLPGGPLVDAWTPSQPQVDRIHALSIAGRNLAGTTVTPSVGGRILLHSVETSDTEITALLEVLPNAPTGPIDLIVADAQGRTVTMPITIVPTGKSLLASRNLTESRDGEKLDYSTYRRPEIWFQEFTIRDPDKTELVPEGLRIQEIDRERLLAERSEKSISFELYIRVTIPLVRVQWQKVILFDPVTGAIGDAVLQALGVGARVPIGAFVISAYFQMDLTIYFRLTNAGFTFPRFCIEITYGIEVTGFDGFAYNRSFCVGGGWRAFGTGTVSSGEITGGECASVTPVGIDDGILEATVEQNACCAQPIGVAMSGHTFTGLSWGRSFSASNPAAGTTTTNQANCPCPCSVALQGTALTPGSSTTGNINLKNTSTASCTYQYEVRQASGQTQMNLANHQGALTVNANQTAVHPVTVSFPIGRPSPDVANLEILIQHTDTGGGTHLACQSQKMSCVYPTGETSTFEGWWPVEPSDVARFIGHLTPSSTDFAGRVVTEGEAVPGAGSFDHCYVPGSPFPNYTSNNISGARWDIVNGNKYHEADLIGMKCTAPPNQQCDLNGYYASVGRVPCSMGTTQKMQMFCGPTTAPTTPGIPYADNTFLIEVTANGTRITRDNAVTPLH